jgi:AraC-like DNA-binding protein
VVSSRSRRPPGSEVTALWHLPGFGGLDVMRATYHSHCFPPHVHDTFVVQLVESGTDAFVRGRESHQAAAGDIVLINPGDVHTGRPAGHTPLCYRALYPRPSLLAEVARSLGQPAGRVPVFPRAVVRDPPLADRLRQLFRALQSGGDSPGVGTQLRATLAALLCRHGSFPADSRPRPGGRAAVRRARDYIRAHPGEPLSLEELSGVAGLSPFHFLRVFRREVGLPPHEFHVSVRVEHARGLLSLGLPIAEAAARTGFADQSHLTRWFKRIVGVTPGQFQLRSNPVQDRTAGPRDNC